MTVIDLLRQAGLNQYEADAYATLLTHGPLTGYELGKRSAVPLSRSYDVLERLTAKGLALVQPGEPPHYLAQPQQQFLAQLQASMAATLDGLVAAFSDLPAPDQSKEFWVLRGRPAILARAVALVAGARESVRVSLTTGGAAGELGAALAKAQAGGRRLHRFSLSLADGIALLVDNQEALLGMLAPVTSCQAVVSSNPALVAALAAALGGSVAAPLPRMVAVPSLPALAPLDWMAWEERKQRQVWPGRDRPERLQSPLHPR
jgi:HTH-type transcriptional regulator, sugar sensing transcriptional regulator